MLSSDRKMLVALLPLTLMAGGAAAQVAVPAVPPEDMPAGTGPRGTSGSAQFDDAGRVGVDPAVQGVGATVAGLAPGYAEVTSLDNGKTVLVLVTPGQGGRFAAVSPTAAKLLNISDGALVRVRSVEPPPQDRAALRAGKPASPRLDTPLALLAPLRRRVEAGNAVAAPQPAPRIVTGPGPVKPPLAVPLPETAASHPSAAYPRPVAASSHPTPLPKSAPAPARPSVTGSYFVQVAALSSQPRAQELAHSLGGQAQQAGKLWRVRLGPFADASAAQRARDGAAKRGYAGAQIVHQ
jgi:rare lipoprotein A